MILPDALVAKLLLARGAAGASIGFPTAGLCLHRLRSADDNSVLSAALNNTSPTTNAAVPWLSSAKSDPTLCPLRQRPALTSARR